MTRSSDVPDDLVRARNVPRSYPSAPSDPPGSLPWRASSSRIRFSAAEPGRKLPVIPAGPKSWSLLANVMVRGMKEEEMMAIAALIDKALTSGGEQRLLAEVRAEVKQLTSHYPLPG